MWAYPSIKHLQYAVCKRLTLGQRTHKLKMRGWKKIFHANGNDRKEVVILTSDEIVFKQRPLRKTKKDTNDKMINLRRGYYSHQYICP